MWSEYTFGKEALSIKFHDPSLFHIDWFGGVFDRGTHIITNILTLPSLSLKNGTWETFSVEIWNGDKNTVFALAEAPVLEVLPWDSVFRHRSKGPSSSPRAREAGKCRGQSLGAESPGLVLNLTLCLMWALWTNPPHSRHFHCEKGEQKYLIQEAAARVKWPRASGNHYF